MFTFIAGLLFPGLGLWIHKKWLSGLLVSIGIFTPLVWSLLMLNQFLNDRILSPAGAKAATLLDGRLSHHWAELPPLPTHVVVLFVLTMILHVLTALSAAKEA
ncbi:MAG TPA: hypothetical protein EYN06_01830 [Myxococcales bacterium]|nr:hypothetical protein [Myxococcales bacterium]HIN85190.1 hypothetical protein [Myxococcales bacterium]